MSGVLRKGGGLVQDVTMAHDKDSAAESLEARLAASRARYWRANLLVMGLLLAVWAATGFGAAIFLGDWLNELTLPGTHFPLGFWFAQQGAIVVFVLVILVYCVVMNRLDARHHAEREALLRDASREAGQ